MAFCGEASTWAKVALILTVIGFAMHCAGYGTNYWMVRYTVRDDFNYGIGLWRKTDCSGYYKAPCTDSEFPEAMMKDYVKAVRGMETIALIVFFTGMICLFFYVASKRSRTRGMAISVMIILFLGALASIIGMAVWLCYMPEYHYANYSMGLTVFAITLAITAGILLIPDIREYDYKDVLKVGGQFQNFPVHPVMPDEFTSPHPPPVESYKDTMSETVIPQNPMAAPVYQYVQYKGKRGKMDGF